MPPSDRELLMAEMYRREADRIARKEGKRAEIYGILRNPWTGRSESYIRFVDLNPNEDTHEDLPD